MSRIECNKIRTKDVLQRLSEKGASDATAALCRRRLTAGARQPQALAARAVPTPAGARPTELLLAVQPLISL